MPPWHLAAAVVKPGYDPPIGSIRNAHNNAVCENFTTMRQRELGPRGLSPKRRRNSSRRLQRGQLLARAAIISALDTFHRSPTRLK
jgi:hypothetical protein